MVPNGMGNMSNHTHTHNPMLVQYKPTCQCQAGVIMGEEGTHTPTRPVSAEY